MMNILVTGANGFIGSNIIELLSNNTNFNFCTGMAVGMDRNNYYFCPDFFATS